MADFDFSSPLVLTITALTNYLRELLETDEVLQDLWVRGEISNFSRPRSGHLYFTLKDSEAQIRCVIWRNAAMRLSFAPSDGMAVEAHGTMSIYAASGQVQLYIDSMRPAGEGALYQEFMRLKARLEAEGLFDPAHKRPLPELPKHIGIVTSASGAALQDMLNTLSRRLPTTSVHLAACQVQGVEAPPAIVRAIQRLNQLPELDLIIVGRGGGSIEDLWAFNDEQVARAIYASRVPVISGVGHETDFTIADFVADLRAPTPTAAAELATPVTIIELGTYLRGADETLSDLIDQHLSSRSYALNLAQSELKRSAPQQRLRNSMQQQDDLRERLDRAIQGQLRTLRLTLHNTETHLESLNPLAVLARGFSIITDAASGQVISHTAQARARQAVTLRVQDGSLNATINADQSGE